MVVDPKDARDLVIETFRHGCKERVYERFHAEGRLLPDGLHFVASWLVACCALRLAPRQAPSFTLSRGAREARGFQTPAPKKV